MGLMNPSIWAWAETEPSSKVLRRWSRSAMDDGDDPSLATLSWGSRQELQKLPSSKRRVADRNPGVKSYLVAVECIGTRSQGSGSSPTTKASVDFLRFVFFDVKSSETLFRKNNIRPVLRCIFIFIFYIVGKSIWN